jgi:hypothetical protein
MRGVEECSEHVSKILMLLTHAKPNKKSVYLSALDCKDPFRSVMHDALFRKMKKVMLLEPLIEVIIYLYKGSVVRVYNQGKVSESVATRKRVKQGCQLLSTFPSIHFLAI